MTTMGNEAQTVILNLGRANMASPWFKQIFERDLHAHSHDKPTRKDSIMPSRCGGALDNHTKNEDGGVDDDGVLARDQLGKEAAIKGAEPGSQFEDGREPALFLFSLSVPQPTSAVWGPVVGGERNGRFTNAGPK
jgi:hypothetical protein